MSTRYKRCKENGLWCFVDTTTSYYASYIAVYANCSLFVSNKE